MSTDESSFKTDSFPLSITGGAIKGSFLSLLGKPMARGEDFRSLFSSRVASYRQPKENACL